MKKALFLTLMVSTMLLTSCFGKKEAARPAPEETPANVVQPAVPATQPTTAKSSPPSFQEGDFYLQALQRQDLELCKKIGSQKLRERCELKVQTRLDEASGTAP